MYAVHRQRLSRHFDGHEFVAGVILRNNYFKVAKALKGLIYFVIIWRIIVIFILKILDNFAKYKLRSKFAKVVISRDHMPTESSA
jgi:hypothetical protein